MEAGPRLNIETAFPMFVDSHVKDKTVATVLFLTWDPYTGKPASLYWDAPQGPQIWRLSRRYIYKYIYIYMDTIVMRSPMIDI